MAAMAEEPSSQTLAYRIRFRGTLGSTWFAMLQDASISSARRGSDTESTLVGTIPDEAALIGVVNLLHQVGCSLISVESCRADEASRFDALLED
jgi:hypothetical protein